MSSYIFGVDIGGTTVKLGLFTQNGELLEKWEIPTHTENQGEAILPEIAQTIMQCMERRAIRKEDVKGIGMGVPAPIGENGIVYNTANLGWGYKEVKREMMELTGLPVITGNDANVAALGEMWMGAGDGEKNMVMVTLGTGVGGGIIIDGRPLIGAGGAGGEIGHICVNYSETDSCGCGKQGCLEQYASATGIAKLAKQRLAKDQTASVLRTQECVDAKAVFDALKAGDQLAEEVVEAFSDYLGRGLAIVAVLADPRLFVIGGGVSKAGPILLERIRKHYLKYAFFMNREVQFVLAKLENDAGICGAAKLVLDWKVL